MYPGARGYVSFGGKLRGARVLGTRYFEERLGQRTRRGRHSTTNDMVQGAGRSKGIKVGLRVDANS